MPCGTCEITFLAVNEALRWVPIMQIEKRRLTLRRSVHQAPGRHCEGLPGRDESRPYEGDGRIQKCIIESRRSVTHQDGDEKTVKNTSSDTELDASSKQQKLQTLYEENLDLIYRYVYSKVGNREEAEDLTSQIFLKAVSGINLERSPQSIQKWLYQIAHSTVADYWRSYYRLPSSSLDKLLEAGWQGPLEDEPTTPDSKPEYQVQRILQALPERYCEVLICRFLLKLSVKNTALRMGLTEANVKILQFRALKRAAQLENTPSQSRRAAG
jgi:RNA polymerase sigma-70 factor, ECF subfamily